MTQSFKFRVNKKLKYENVNIDKLYIKVKLQIDSNFFLRIILSRANKFENNIFKERTIRKFGK